MSYSKKDEDADSALMRVDRTSVFQEGQLKPLPSISLLLTPKKLVFSIPPLFNLAGVVFS